MKLLKESLKDWTDCDVAEHGLAISLGLMDDSVSFSSNAKHVYWTTNAIGDNLHEALNLFVKAGFIERREEPDIQFRWNKDFKSTWE